MTTEPRAVSGATTNDPVEQLVESMLRGTNLSVEAVLRSARRAGLLGDATGDDGVPTVAEFYSVVENMATASNGDEKRGGGSFRTWEPYWRLFVEGYPYQHKGQVTKDGSRIGNTPVRPEDKLWAGCGHLKLTEVKPSHLKEAQDWAARRAELNLAWRSWRREDDERAMRESELQGAYRCFHGAMRFFFKSAVGERHLTSSMNPTDSLPRPPKPKSNRREFTNAELTELWTAVVSGGNDPELDALLWETVLVTAARREGLINLNLSRLDKSRGSVWLEEKGGKIVEQPATVDLVGRLEAFARSRGATKPSDPVFAFKIPGKNGRPKRITERRLDTMHTRVQTTLPWADKLGVTIHWGRHHAIQQIRHIAGADVAGRYARHANTSTTAVYAKVSGEEVCAAVGIMTGSAHPLTGGGW